MNGLTTGTLSNSRTSEDKQEHLAFMASHLDSIICTEVSNVVQVHDGGPIDWNGLEEGLKSRVGGKLNIALACSEIPEAENERPKTELMNLV